MSTKSSFSLMSIPRYLWSGPAHIGQVLAQQGATAASKTARFYSMALCLTVLAIYFLMSCALGFLQVQAGGTPDLSDPRVLVFMIPAAVVWVAANLVALWAAVLGAMGLFRRDAPAGTSIGALLWGIALVIFYAGFASGLLGLSH